MITYNTAKKLKNAGYYKGRELECMMNEKLKKFPNKPYNYEGQDAVHAPTLSELIRACGNKMYLLIQGTNIWSATEGGKKDLYTGKTPEEAVANLWLSFNS